MERGDPYLSSDSTKIIRIGGFIAKIYEVVTSPFGKHVTKIPLVDEGYQRKISNNTVGYFPLYEI